MTKADEARRKLQAFLESAPYAHDEAVGLRTRWTDAEDFVLYYGDLRALAAEQVPTREQVENAIYDAINDPDWMDKGEYHTFRPAAQRQYAKRAAARLYGEKADG